MAEGFNLIDTEYVAEHYLLEYARDAVSQLLTNRQGGNTIKPCKFFKEYFTSVHQGTHILFREFAFVSATPYNRLCVLKAIVQIFKPFIYLEDRYNARDYHSILMLVWPDFPMQVVQDAFTTYDDDKKDEDNCIRFLDFIKAMKLSFCTGRFDYEASIIAKQLEAKIDEYSKIPSQSGDAGINLCEADFLVNVDDDNDSKPFPWAAIASKVLDASEFKRILNINDSNSISSDEPLSGKISRSSSESKEASKSVSEASKTKKKGVRKGSGAKKGAVSKPKPRGRLASKQLSHSLNVLESEKDDADSKKAKRRNRSKSATSATRAAAKKPWR